MLVKHLMYTHRYVPWIPVFTMEDRTVEYKKVVYVVLLLWEAPGKGAHRCALHPCFLSRSLNVAAQLAVLPRARYRTTGCCNWASHRRERRGNAGGCPATFNKRERSRDVRRNGGHRCQGMPIKTTTIITSLQNFNDVMFDYYIFRMRRPSENSYSENFWKYGITRKFCWQV